jgi:CubicO group peptidase (beta-lactamase class C family)
MRTVRISLSLLAALALSVLTTPRIKATGADEREATEFPVPAIERLDAYLERLAAMGFSGAVLVEHDRKVALRRGYGMADREARQPYTPETVQTHGSITKQITAAAILLLETRGALRVADPLSRHVGEVPPDKREITLHHLLNHTAGLPDAIGRDAEPIGTEEFLARALATPLDFVPGTRFQYSNVGYSLLGIVIERVSGRGYEAFVREALLLPAGLADTGYLLPAWAESRLAVGYLDGRAWGRVHRRSWRDDGPGWNLRANGGMHTTVDDMRRWLAVLRGEGPLPPAAVHRWIEGSTPMEPGVELEYAYGWAVGETELGRVVTHNGGNGIFSADFIWLPDAELFLYIQGNSSVVEASQLQDALLGALYDPEFVLPPVLPSPAATPAVDPARSAALVGTYAAPGGAVTLADDDVRLLATLSGQPLLDAVFGHDAAQRERFAHLNERALEAARRLREGREDAFAGLVGPDEDAVARARRMLEVIARTGRLESVTLVGSVTIAPGSRFAGESPWATLLRADYLDRVQIWSLLWRDDFTYSGTAIGPLADAPSFVLVPMGEATDSVYVAVEREAPWRKATFRFAEDCLTVADLRACR